LVGAVLPIPGIWTIGLRSSAGLTNRYRQATNDL
jgi:hypothetical protein